MALVYEGGVGFLHVFRMDVPPGPGDEGFVTPDRLQDLAADFAVAAVNCEALAALAMQHGVRWRMAIRGRARAFPSDKSWDGEMGADAAPFEHGLPDTVQDLAMAIFMQLTVICEAAHIATDWEQSGGSGVDLEAIYSLYMKVIIDDTIEPSGLFDGGEGGDGGGEDEGEDDGGEQHQYQQQQVSSAEPPRYPIRARELSSRARESREHGNPPVPGFVPAGWNVISQPPRPPPLPAGREALRTRIVTTPRRSSSTSLRDTLALRKLGGGPAKARRFVPYLPPAHAQRERVAKCLRYLIEPDTFPLLPCLEDAGNHLCVFKCLALHGAIGDAQLRERYRSNPAVFTHLVLRLFAAVYYPGRQVSLCDLELMRAAARYDGTIFADLPFVANRLGVRLAVVDENADVILPAVRDEADSASPIVVLSIDPGRPSHVRLATRVDTFASTEWFAASTLSAGDPRGARRADLREAEEACPQADVSARGDATAGGDGPEGLVPGATVQANAMSAVRCHRCGTCFPRAGDRNRHSSSGACCRCRSCLRCFDTPDALAAHRCGSYAHQFHQSEGVDLFTLDELRDRRRRQACGDANGTFHREAQTQLRSPFWIGYDLESLVGDEAQGGLHREAAVHVRFMYDDGVDDAVGPALVAALGRGYVDGADPHRGTAFIDGAGCLARFLLLLRYLHAAYFADAIRRVCTLRLWNRRMGGVAGWRPDPTVLPPTDRELVAMIAHMRVAIVAHNGARYDGNFILQAVAAEAHSTLRQTFLPSPSPSSSDAAAEDGLPPLSIGDLLMRGSLLLSFTILSFRFIDSYRFLPFSLAFLAKTFLSGGSDAFLRHEKGLWPYRWFSHPDQMNARWLLQPFPTEAGEAQDEAIFYHRITFLLPARERAPTIYDFDSVPADGCKYVHRDEEFDGRPCLTIQRWNRWLADEGCEFDVRARLRSYCANDVYLLTEVWRRFRTRSIDAYSIDPNTLVSAPGMAYTICKTMCNTRLITLVRKDTAQWLYRARMGGHTEPFQMLATCDAADPVFSRPLLPPDAVPALCLFRAIAYIDVNSLYPFILYSHGFPCGVPRSFTDDEACAAVRAALNRCRTYCLDEQPDANVAHRGPMARTPNLVPWELPQPTWPYGFVEVDLEPPMLEGSLPAFFAPMPEKRHTSPSSAPPTSSNALKQRKLLFHWQRIERAVMHTEELKCYVANFGWTVARVHRYDEWQHTRDITRTFVAEMYTRRLAADNEVDKTFYKLMMNSLFGRFMLNTSKLTRAHMVFCDDSLASLETGGRTITEFKLVNPQCALVHTRDAPYESPPADAGSLSVRDAAALAFEATPLQVGICVTAMARAYMSMLYLRLMRALNPRPDGRLEEFAHAQILYMDTDSFMIGLRTDEAVARWRTDAGLRRLMGTRLGQFKEEAPLGDITGLCALAPKTYALRMRDGSTQADVSKAKGASMRLNAPRMRYDSFVETLLGGDDVVGEYDNIQRDRNVPFCLRSIRGEKVLLRARFDKRWFPRGCKILSLPLYSHP